LIARSSVFFRQVEGVETDPQGSSSETDRDLTKTPKPVHHPEFGSSCHSSSVKGAAAGGDEVSTVNVGTAPAGV
jgi:hypothetical protein